MVSHPLLNNKSAGMITRSTPHGSVGFYLSLYNMESHCNRPQTVPEGTRFTSASGNKIWCTRASSRLGPNRWDPTTGPLHTRGNASNSESFGITPLPNWNGEERERERGVSDSVYVIVSCCGLCLKLDCDDARSVGCSFKG